MKHAREMSRDELLALPIYNDAKSSIAVLGASVFMPPASVKDNLPDTVEDPEGGKWRISLISDQWMRYRSIVSDDAPAQSVEATPYSE